MNTLLHARWKTGISAFCASPDIAEDLYKDIEQAYGGANRHYHNLFHLEFMFSEIDRENIGNTAIEFATWYHDFIYRPGSKRNERKSADIARHALALLGAKPVLIDRVAGMILATRHHACDPGDETTALFLDIDMAVLGTDEVAYQRYADAVRKEVWWLPDFAYRKARSEFLASLAQRNAIFLTPRFHARYEKPARENIERELFALNV
jgi:predicted metal-dependent HD superfamily phosphohydrolase